MCCTVFRSRSQTYLPCLTNDSSEITRAGQQDHLLDEKLTQSRFLRACRHEPVDATPVWFMRQAGRYMPEYRAIREHVSMLDAIRTPEIACQITLQPINALALDAAILFNDILIPLIGMGIGLDFGKGEGPQLVHPIRRPRDGA